MTRQQYEREQFLTQMDDYGIGFRKGTPFVPLSKFEIVTRWFTGLGVGAAFILALVVVFFWARSA